MVMIHLQVLGWSSKYMAHTSVNCQGRAIKTLSEKLGGSALLQEKPILPGVETSGGCLSVSQKLWRYDSKDGRGIFYC